jgi:DNA helicase II / ATP-dependent DNA helicase PcrA
MAQNTVDPLQQTKSEFTEERNRADFTLDQIRQVKSQLEKALNYMGEENLRKLKDLRDNAEANPTDLFVFIEQLHAQNQAFNFKDKFAQMEEYGYLIAEPYFSRIDLANADDGQVDRIYIGKFGVAADSGLKKPLVTDWRAKIASVYYRYRYPQKNVVYDTEDGKVTRDLKLKRTFEFDNGELLKFYNNDIQLDENEIIGEKIAKRSGGVLEDIVATIQESQMEIIEYDPRGVCVVQGCVGSGKSTVAIHKLSHIFFNYAGFIRPQNSLLVAKNQILVGYLSTLFPKLGIFDLNYGTLKDLLVRIVFAHEIKVTLELSIEDGMEQVNSETIAELQKSNLEIRNYVEGRITVLEENPLYASYFSFVYDADMSAQENLQLLVEDLEEEIKYQKEKLDAGATGSSEVRCLNNIKNIKNLLKEVRKVSNNLRLSTFPLLLKKFDINTKQKLGYADALKFVYLYVNVFGIPKFKKFEYCVVDEGQDFSLLEYLVLNKLVIRGRFCILGDLNQSYIKTGLSNWEEVEEVITDAKERKKFELTTNYRSTKPIIDFACKIISKYSSNFLPQSINRKGSEVEEVNTNSASIVMDVFSHLLDELKSLDKSIGIICYDAKDFLSIQDILEKEYRGILKDRLVVLNPKERIFYTPKGVYLTMFENCKGLEFAKVYVVGMSKTPKDLFEAKKNYVSTTRAMNELVVFYRQDVPILP